jgi:hypothetical protein
MRRNVFELTSRNSRSDALEPRTSMAAARRAIRVRISGEATNLVIAGLVPAISLRRVRLCQ